MASCSKVRLAGTDKRGIIFPCVAILDVWKYIKATGSYKKGQSKILDLGEHVCWIIESGILHFFYDQICWPLLFFMFHHNFIVTLRDARAWIYARRLLLI